MLGNVAKKIFGSKNDRTLKRMGKTVQQINGFEETLAALSDEQLKAKTGEFKKRLEQGETLDQLLPEAFSVVRAAGQRVLGMRHFDVQMIGGITLHQGRIAEMRTGEGKTLMATLPVYLNALTGEGAFVITVNDYLASRDANWMRPVYEFLGMTVGVVVAGQDPEQKRAAYQCDITYGTNNEFGFDYLRDNMAFTLEDRFQRSLNFAIVDEVDSILIDEARTPLIISGQAEDSSELYRRINELIPKLILQTEETEGHFTVDEKARQIELTEQGLALGLNRVDVSQQVRNSFFGAQVQRIQRGRDDVRVMVRLPIEERRSVADLKDILIKTPAGGTVPLSHVATLVPSQSPSSIYRIDRYRTLNVTADVEKSNTNIFFFYITHARAPVRSCYLIAFFCVKHLILLTF